MSWGERSCKYYAKNCPNPNVDFNICNLDCSYYESKGKEPDSKTDSRTIDQMMMELLKISPKPRKGAGDGN
jgi:hypothetical protein